MSSLHTSLFFDLFLPLPRQGPGDLPSMRRALALCGGLPPAPRVLDLGCGAGAQTVDLARETGGTVLAVDALPELVRRVRERAAAAALSDRIEAREQDMATLEDAEGFDLVWSEGALYNLGLPAALELCARLVKPGGHLAFTEAVYRTDAPHADVRAAFADYAGMGTVEDALRHIAVAPWDVRGHFLLPDAAWWTHFYGPMEERLAALRAEHAGDAEAQAVLDGLAAEPAMYRAHGHQYGYAFFVLRRT
jgi:SAM-dependent methyltransferase